MRLTRLAALIALVSAPALADTPLAVEIITAKAVPDERVYSLTGEIRARDELAVAFPQGGRIAEVLVDAGTTVAPGAVLARLDAVQQEQALRAAEAGLSTALADHRQARENLDRQEALLDRGATTRIARDSAEDALRIAEGALAQAEAVLDRAKKALADTEIVAPGDATVTSRMAEAGQVVGAAQPVLELALGTGFDAVFDVPEGMMTLGPPPESVMLNAIDTPEVTFTGRITEVSPVVDARTGTVAVTVGVDDPPDELSYGDPVRGSVTLSGPAYVVLPYTVITAVADSPAVWQVDPGTMAVSLKPVSVERYETGTVVLAGGISDGAMIVGRGAQLLYPGRVVRAVEAGQ